MKTALITGSSSGLGLEIAKNLSKNNYKLILTGRSLEKLTEARSLLENPDIHLMYPGDLTDGEFLTQFLSILINQKLIPDVVVHSLGGKVSGDEHPLSVDALQRSIRLNLEVSVELNSYFFPYMIERNQGRVIHISSDASLSGQSAPGYAAAKSAINGYVKSTARYYSKYGVMICAALPGIFESQCGVWAEKKVTQPEYYKSKVAQMPLGRFPDVSEVADFVSHLVLNNSITCSGSLIPLTAAYF